MRNCEKSKVFNSEFGVQDGDLAVRKEAGVEFISRKEAQRERARSN